MPNLPLKRFEELDHTEERISLDWFGGIRPNFDEPDNPLIECVFSPVIESNISSSNGLPIPSLRSRVSEQFRAAITTGYLPSLFLGKLYRNGKAENTNTSMSREVIEFEFDAQDEEKITETTLQDLCKPNDIKIKPLFRETVARSGIKILDGHIRKTDYKNIQSNLDKFKGKAPLKVVIHEMEMIRYYMTNSEYSCKMLMTGAFSNENLYRQVINRNIEEPGYSVTLDAHRFVYRHGYRADDVPTLGRILFAPENVGLRAAQRVSKLIARDRINITNGGVGYPRTHFPFKAVTRLTLVGRRMQINNDWYFQADRILDCTAPFPFKRLSFSDEIEKGGNPAPPDATAAFANQETIDEGPAHSGNNGGYSRNDQRPSATSESLHSTLGTRTYSGLIGVELIREKLRDSTHHSRLRHSRYVETLVDASTGMGTSGSSSAAKQKIEEKIVRASKLTRSLSTFLSAIENLKSKAENKVWKIQTIGVGSTFEEQGEVFSLFPKVECDVRTKSRQFSYMDKERKIWRRLICAEIEVQKKYLYLFEAQRRPKDIAKDDDDFNHKELLPILLLRRPGYESCLGSDFLGIIEQTVREKLWPSVNKYEFIRDQMSHCKAESTIDDLSERLQKFIVRNLPST